MSEERQQARVIQNGNPFADAVRQLAPRAIRTVVDAGANVGDVCVHLLANFGDCTVYAFEPDPDCFATLRSRFESDDRVRVVALGLSSANEKRVLHRYRESGLNALRPLSTRSAPYLEDYGTSPTDDLSIDTTTLDDFCRQQGIEQIDFLKLDIQGWEIECFRGTRQMLSDQRVGAIYCEVNFVELYEEQIYYEDVAIFLRQFGYRLFNLYALSFNADGQLVWADALFLPLM